MQKENITKTHHYIQKLEAMAEDMLSDVMGMLIQIWRSRPRERGAPDYHHVTWVTYLLWCNWTNLSPSG